MEADLIECVKFCCYVLDPVICVVCAKLAMIDVEDPANRDFFHWINFLFVKGDFQVRMLNCIVKPVTTSPVLLSSNHQTQFQTTLTAQKS